MPRSFVSLTARTRPLGQNAPERAFVLIGLVVGAGVAGAAALMPAGGFAAPGLSMAVMAVVVALGAAGVRRDHPHPRLGPANMVTLGRAGIAAFLAAVLALPGGIAERPALAWGLVCLVSLGLALDGVDGWLARRSGLASHFGARFDMEVDALLAALLCLMAMQAGKAGLWLLPLGFLRYAWVLAGLGLPWLTRDLPDRAGRKTACVVQIAVLTALLCPVVLPPVSVWLAGGAMAALVLSFAVDAVWLWRRR